MLLRLLGAVLLLLEAIGVAALAIWQIVAAVAGDTDSIDSALALILLTVVGAAAVAAFAVAVWRDRSWGRSGGIVVQALILSVAIGELTGEAADPALAALIALPGVVGLVVLFLGVRAAIARARAEDAGDASA